MKLKQMWSVPALLLVAVGTVQAAPVVVPVTGSWTGLLNWNPGGPALPVVAPNAPDGGPNMALSGSMTIDDVSGVISALTLTGATTIGPWAAAPADGDVTWSGFSWELNGTSLNQTGAPSLLCNGVEFGAGCGPGYDNGAAAILTLSDFTGIGAGGLLAGGELISERPGVTSLIGGGANLGDITTLDLWSGFNIFGPINSAANATFELQVVPIPAAVWLFASGLGMLGWTRRKATV